MRMKGTRTRLIGFVPVMFVGLALTVVTLGPQNADARRMSFNGSCNQYWYNTDPIKRSNARSYAYVARYEGYEWGGGCWNDNNVDDTPSAPDSGGEGGDCSGFTWKAWHERNETWDDGFRFHSHMQDKHGPYNAQKFKDGEGTPNMKVAKSDTRFMDAFASSGHIGMIYEANTDVNTDRIIEAKGEAYGTNIWSRTYRGNSDYSGVRRTGWLPECYPTCGAE